MWWIWLATAQAASFPTEGLDALFTEVQGQIEGIAGRAFKHVPAREITVTPIAQKRIVDAFNEANPGLGAEERRRRLEELGGDIWGAAAFYTHGERKIVLLDDVIAAAFSARHTAEEVRTESIRCLVAHELTHALQHDHELPNDRTDGRRALIEGQAEWVAHRVCTGAGERVERAFDGATVVGSLDSKDPSIFAYVYGERFMETYVNRYGVEAMWRLMAQPTAPTREDVELVVKAQELQGWGSAEPLAKAFAARMGLKATADKQGPMSPDFLLTDAASAAGMPATRVLAGLHASFRVNTRRSGVMSFVFDNDEAAAGLVRQRREVLREMREGTLVFTKALFYENRIHTLMPLAAGVRPAGVGESVDSRRKIGGNEWYDEVWAARGRQVVGVTWEGRAPGSTLAKAVADVFALGLPLVPPALDTNPAALAALEKYAPPG